MTTTNKNNSSSLTTLLATAALVAALMIPTVTAHGRLVNPQPLVDRDIRVERRGQPDTRRGPCGTRDLAAAIAAAQPVTVTPGTNTTFTWRITNGDGAGPIAVKIDPAGSGSSFPINLPVVQQVPGRRGLLSRARRQNANFTVTLPADLKCDPRCLMQVTQPVGFGSCGVLVLGQAAGGNLGNGTEPGNGNNNTTAPLPVSTVTVTTTVTVTPTKCAATITPIPATPAPAQGRYY